MLMGCPEVPIHELDWLVTSALMIVPHISAAVPNGIWSIERGEQHPFVLAASKLRVYALFGKDGQPDFYCRANMGHIEVRCDSGAAMGIDLFTSLRSARSWIKQEVDDGQPKLIAHLLTPRELLSCLSRVDIASINMADFAMTRRGQLALCHENVAASHEVLQALAR